jgi:hypothetical protein
MMGVRVTRSLVLCVCFGDRCLSFCTFFFTHCVVCSSSIYRFWLPLWYLQTLLSTKTQLFPLNVSMGDSLSWKVYSCTTIALIAEILYFLNSKFVDHHYEWFVPRYNQFGLADIRVVRTSRSLHHSRLITGFVTRLTRRVSLVGQILLTLPEHLSSLPVFSGVRVTRSLVLCVMFCRSLFVFLSLFSWPLCSATFI